MEWCHESNSKNKRPPKTNPKRQRKRNYICYELIFFMFHNKYCRVFILTVVILSLAYYYNTMAVSKAKSSQDDIHIPFAYTTDRTRTTKATKTAKVLASERSTAPDTQSADVKLVPNLQDSRVKFAAMSLRSPSRLTRASGPRNKKSNPTFDTDCRMFSCFNYSRCPLTGSFPIYLYDHDILYNGTEGVTGTGPIREMLSVNNYITSDPKEACLFIVIAGLPYSVQEEKEISSQLYKMVNEATLNTLPHWGRNGQNHLLLNVGYGTFTSMTGSAMIAQTMFTHERFRPGFDIVMPIAQGSIPMRGEVWSLSPPMNLARRAILLSFQGQLLSEMTHQNAERDNLAKVLQDFERVGDKTFHLHFDCQKVDNLFEHGIDDWAICLKQSAMIKSTLRKSTFALLLAPSDYTYASTNLLQIRLYEALEAGAVPVILGGDRIRLPFEEVLDWRRAVISLPTARVTDLKFLLKSMADEDILAFRKHGRMLWERYLGSVQASVDSLLAVIRTRLNIAPQLPKFQNLSRFDFSFPEVTHGNKVRIQSNRYKRNLTVGLLNSYEQWNLWGDPFALYPQLPWDPILTPEARFLIKSTEKLYQGACKPQAGDRPVEEFTAVILTYNRKAVLDKLIIQVSQLPYLNKILVVCNGPSKLARKNWPNTVPIVVVYASQNTLNNRFVPYDMIETDAVLSLDDDVIMKSKEIEFAFRVWRQHRDQIVGFFGRNMEWDSNKKGFRYSTYDEKSGNVFCQVHMVLTGAAFYHRFYFWAYWRILPQSVRNFVDKLKNCEDIAMNFLVSYISRKPPIKMGSDWTEHQRRNQSYKLSCNSDHYKKRNKCMKYFAKVMGYTPLLTTSYRVIPIPAYRNKKNTSRYNAMSTAKINKSTKALV